MRGRGGSGNRGGGNFNRGGGNRGGGGGGGNRGRQEYGNKRFDDDQNLQTVECGTFDYVCNGNAIFKLSNPDKKVPLTKTFLYDSNQNKIGLIKDVFGPMDNVYFEMEPNEGILDTLKPGYKVFAPIKRINPASFYTEDQQPRRRGGGGGRGGRGGGGRGGRGGGNRCGRGGRGGGGRGRGR